jgi:hypothetical protein
MDIWMFAVWFSCNLLLGVTSWKQVSAWYPCDHGMILLMHSLVLAWASIVLVAILLSIANLLAGWSLMLGVAVLCTASLLRLRLDRRAASLSSPAVESRETPWLWCWTTLLTLALGHSITSGVLQLPSDWDTLTYHLPMIVHWLQTGSLYAPHCRHWSNPGNNEILGLWFVAPYSGDFLIALNNLPATVLLACAAVEVGKNLGLSSALAHATGFAVVSNYVVMNQLLDASNDVAVAALFLACLAYGLRACLPSPSGPGASFTLPSPSGRGAGGEGSSRFDLLLFAVCLGLLAGVKFYALGYAALAGTTFVLFCWKRQGWRRAAALAAVSLAGLFVWAGYWYIRNAWITGSPLYPKGFDPQTDVMTRIYPDIAHTSFVGNGRPELLELSIEAVWHMSGPCHLVALVFAPLTFVWLLLSGWKRSPGRDVRWAFAMLLAGACCVLVITPFAVEDEPGTLNQMRWHYCPVRYGLCFLSLAVLGLSLVLQDISGADERPVFSWKAIPARLPCGFFLAGGLYQLAFPDSHLSLDKTQVILIAGNLCFLLANGVLLAHLWPRLSKVLLLVALLALLGGGAWAIDRRANDWHENFPAFYDRKLSARIFSLLENESPQSRICVMDHRGYPFFGSRRQFRVCQPVYVPSGEWLMNYLREQDVHFIAVRLHHGTEGWHVFEHFDECLRDHPGVFQRLSKDSDPALYRVVENVP